MGLPLEWWKPGPRDLASYAAESLFRSVVTSTAAVTVTAFYEVPVDRILILEGLNVSTQAGAAQTTATITAFVSVGAEVVSYLFQNPNVTTLSASLDRQYNALWIPGGSRVQGQATFSAGAAANAVRTNLQGYLAPKGSYIGV